MAITWFSNRPFRGRSPHPIALDIAEQALAATDSSLLATAASALAPRWEELEEYGLTGIEFDLETGPLRSEIDRPLEHYLGRGESSIGTFLLEALAVAVAGLGPRYGAKLYCSLRWDTASRTFANRLQEESKTTGFRVMIPVRSPRIDASQPSSPSGWGYLRRGGAALANRDEEAIRRQHPTYINGILSLAPEFAHQQLVALSRIYWNRRIRSRAAAHIYLTTARLTMTIPMENQFAVASRFCRRALKCSTHPSDMLGPIEELANVCANQRRGPALAEARRWCERGFRLLPRVEDEEVRFRSEIRLINVLALVEYHLGRNEEALVLENRAMELTEATIEHWPGIALWAKPMLSRNLAQLLALRFSETDKAIELLKGNLHRELTPNNRETDVVNLARMHFDRGEYRESSELLSEYYEDGKPASLTPERELFGRALLGVSLLHLGQQDRLKTQLERMRFLSGLTRSAGAAQLVDALGIRVASLDR